MLGASMSASNAIWPAHTDRATSTKAHKKQRCRAARLGQSPAELRARIMYKTWWGIRKPFCLPPDLAGHSCSRSWEVFDGNLAGCLQCGALHQCDAKKCPTALGSDGYVCTITGLHVASRYMCEMETLDNSSQTQMESVEAAFHKQVPRNQLTDSQANSQTRRRVQTTRQLLPSGAKGRATSRDHHINSVKAFFKSEDSGGNASGKQTNPPARATWRALRNALLDESVAEFALQRFLCSAQARDSLSQDHAKLNQMLRQVVSNRLRSLRQAWGGNRNGPQGLCNAVVNWVDMEADLHAALQDQRIPARHINPQIQNKLLQLCLRYIINLTNFMLKHCTPTPSCLKHTDLLVGMLYQMRVGVVVHGVVVLPRIPLLCYVLPAEQHLATLFGVRAKAISEAENVIKHNLRRLSIEHLSKLGAAA
jgi:hypothetical protein